MVKTAFIGAISGKKGKKGKRGENVNSQSRNKFPVGRISISGNKVLYHPPS